MDGASGRDVLKKRRAQGAAVAGSATVVAEFESTPGQIDIHDPTPATTVHQTLKETKTATLAVTGFEVNILALTSCGPIFETSR